MEKRKLSRTRQKKNNKHKNLKEKCKDKMCGQKEEERMMSVFCAWKATLDPAKCGCSAGSASPGPIKTAHLGAMSMYATIVNPILINTYHFLHVLKVH